MNTVMFPHTFYGMYSIIMRHNVYENPYNEKKKNKIMKKNKVLLLYGRVVWFYCVLYYPLPLSVFFSQNVLRFVRRVFRIYTSRYIYIYKYKYIIYEYNFIYFFSSWNITSPHPELFYTSCAHLNLNITC